MNIDYLKNQLMDGSPLAKWCALRVFIQEGKGSEVNPSVMARIIDERANQTGETKENLIDELTAAETDAKKKRIKKAEEDKSQKDAKVMELINDKEFVSKYTDKSCPRCYQKLKKPITKEHRFCDGCKVDLYQRAYDRAYTEASNIAEKEYSSDQQYGIVKKYSVKGQSVADDIKSFSDHSGLPYDKAYLNYVLMGADPSKVDVDIQFKYYKWSNPGIEDDEALRKIR